MLSDLLKLFDESGEKIAREHRLFFIGIFALIGGLIVTRYNSSTGALIASAGFFLAFYDMYSVDPREIFPNQD